MFRKMLAALSATALLVVGSAGAASAKGESWTGVHKVRHVAPATYKWTHVKPSDGQHWTGESWTGESWTRNAR